MIISPKSNNKKFDAKNKKSAIWIKFFDKLLEKVDENRSFVDECEKC